MASFSVFWSTSSFSIELAAECDDSSLCIVTTKRQLLSLFRSTARSGERSVGKRGRLLNAEWRQLEHFLIGSEHTHATHWWIESMSLPDYVSVSLLPPAKESDTGTHLLEHLGYHRQPVSRFVSQTLTDSSLRLALCRKRKRNEFLMAVDERKRFIHLPIKSQHFTRLPLSLPHPSNIQFIHYHHHQQHEPRATK